MGDVVSLGSEESGKWGWGFSKEVRERSEQVMEEVDLSDFKNRGWQALSGGERQRLALARALIHNPKLLVLDEPSVYLDEKSVEGFTSLVTKLAEERSVLLITHDARLAAIADRQVQLDAPHAGRVCEVAS